jgi:hypothetical protein
MLYLLVYAVGVDFFCCNVAVTDDRCRLCCVSGISVSARCFVFLLVKFSLAGTGTCWDCSSWRD